MQEHIGAVLLDIHNAYHKCISNHDVIITEKIQRSYIVALYNTEEIW